MPDNRSLFQKAKDEAKQLIAGAKGAGKILSDKDYFRPGLAAKEAVKSYNKEEKNQAKNRSKNMKMGGKMHDKRYGQGGIMQHD